MEEIRQQMGSDTLGYLSLEGMIRAVRRPMGVFCVACFSGDYPFEEKAGGFVSKLGAPPPMNGPPFPTTASPLDGKQAGFASR